MAVASLHKSGARPRLMTALTLLLLAQYVGVGILMPLHAFTSPLGSTGLRVFAVGLALLGLAAIYGVWSRRPWANWAALAVMSFKLPIDLYNWALELDRTLLPLSEAVNIGIIALVFAMAQPIGPRVTPAQKLFFGCVLALAANVAAWGLLAPERAIETLPFAVPPLHARFLGAMYLSGATFMALGIVARHWHEVRVVTPMVAIWTGMLGVVSLFYLDAFDWTRVQTWTWFVAYSGFPLFAAWIAWSQRGVTERPGGAQLSVALRGYLLVQGAVATLLAIVLLLAPGVMVGAWPWKITPLLAQVYSAPFLSFGIGSLLAARQRGWAEVRIVVYATLVFALAVLISSVIHSSLFDFSSPAGWLWFSGFGFASTALGLFGFVPSLRARTAQF